MLFYYTGFAQGIRRACGGVGTIMGPLWAGGMQNFPFETLAVMMALFILVWVSLSFGHFLNHSLDFSSEATSSCWNSRTESVHFQTSWSLSRTCGFEKGLKHKLLVWVFSWGYKSLRPVLKTKYCGFENTQRICIR